MLDLERTQFTARNEPNPASRNEPNLEVGNPLVARNEPNFELGNSLVPTRSVGTSPCCIRDEPDSSIRNEPNLEARNESNLAPGMTFPTFSGR